MKRELRRMEIEPAENGGHTITHYFKETHNPGKPRSLETMYHEPEKHVFGEDQDHDMLAHVAKHLGLKEASEEEAESK